MPDAPRLLRLTDLPLETPARLAQIQGGRQLVRRLLALGLRQGSPLQVIHRRGRGLVVASGELRIAIGAGIADRLWVEPQIEPLDAVSPSDSAGDQAALETTELERVSD